MCRPANPFCHPYLSIIYKLWETTFTLLTRYHFICNVFQCPPICHWGCNVHLLLGLIVKNDNYTLHKLKPCISAFHFFNYLSLFFYIVFLSFWIAEGAHCNSNGRSIGYVNQIKRLGGHCKLHGSVFFLGGRGEIINSRWHNLNKTCSMWHHKKFVNTSQML